MSFPSIFPAIKNIVASMFSNDIVSVKPMAGPSGHIFYMDGMYGPTLELDSLYVIPGVKITHDGIVLTLPGSNPDTVWLCVLGQDEGRQGDYRLQRVIDKMLVEEWKEYDDIGSMAPMMKKVPYEEAVDLLPSMRGTFLVEDLGL